MPHQTIKIESLRLDLWAKIESHRLEMLVNNIIWEPSLLTIYLENYGHLAILAYEICNQNMKPYKYFQE